MALMIIHILEHIVLLVVGFASGLAIGVSLTMDMVSRVNNKNK